MDTFTTRVTLPLPDLPTNLKSLNRATWFFIDAELLRTSAAQFSSLPAVRITFVPSGISLNDKTLKGTGSVLLQRQCEGNTLHTKFGLSVRTSSPGYSANTSENVLSPLNFFGAGALAAAAAAVCVEAITSKCEGEMERCVRSILRYHYKPQFVQLHYLRWMLG